MEDNDDWLARNKTCLHVSKLITMAILYYNFINTRWFDPGAKYFSDRGADITFVFLFRPLERAATAEQHNCRVAVI